MIYANPAREVKRNTEFMRVARLEGREIDVRVMEGRTWWFVPSDMVARVGNMAVVIEE